MEFLSINQHNKRLNHFVNKETSGKQYEDKYGINIVAGREFSLYG